MKNILIVGGSKGIGNAILLQQLENNRVINISRNAPEVSHDNLTHYSLDVLKDELPQIDNIDNNLLPWFY
jgi:NAD(P)-dependent dehydrogenase (short-subunit alcohol dehydrogenase family)